MANKPRAALQTFHAIQASDLAAAFNDALRRIRIEPGDYGVELTEPEGPSTAGGVQAMQHVRLVPRRAGYPTLIAGHANHANERAELRSYEHLDAAHRQRFKRPLVLDRRQYDAFVTLAKQILDVLHIATSITAPSIDLEFENAAPEPKRGSRLAVVLLVAVALAGAVGLGLWRAGLLGGLVGGPAAVKLLGSG